MCTRRNVHCVTRRSHSESEGFGSLKGAALSVEGRRPRCWVNEGKMDLVRVRNPEGLRRELIRVRRARRALPKGSPTGLPDTKPLGRRQGWPEGRIRGLLGAEDCCRVESQPECAASARRNSSLPETKPVGRRPEGRYRGLVGLL